MAASAPIRPPPGRKASVMRPPAVPRPAVNRAQTATPTLNGRATPMDNKSRTPKRKAPMDVLEVNDIEETNINVVVRCRGRNDREVRENSAVVVSSDGIKGKKVELSMGPNALSNKAYQFDKVFSPAADQEMIFDEVVVPILDEVLAGFNCTIFAYGQTGTGKTYTMSGDISDIQPIPEAAGIIPRVLRALFEKLNADETNKHETSVKCSFIELYNEELRDLLSAEDSTKLKIFDDTSKPGRTATLVQGMEESYIEDASKGLQLLSEGSHRRQVAATKCNDLSSRSHTVFTMTIYTKRPSETGEDYISASKLNLVDLAGSENIQRSGAENKRATEAGLINKSLLTLGRVINALVDRSSHVPYRESKLTRLLQDSLGGPTKTCIIATLSPAKSNLEETISTLDYAFRAKNIRNKPQMNQLISKKTLLREFTSEIEKLKSELIATRHRNGYYLTAEAYEELTTQSESRRILSEEQRDKIETMENNLRNKVQELYSLSNNFQSMKRDNDKIKGRLDSTRDLLDNTELVLGHAKRSLAEETHFRKAYEKTETQLTATGQEMQKTLEVATQHIDKLHAKIERTTSLQDTNLSRWTHAENFVVAGTSTIKAQLDMLQQQQVDVFSTLITRVQSFVKDELISLQLAQQSIEEKDKSLAKAQAEFEQQDSSTQTEMVNVLEEVCALREDVKTKVGSGLSILSTSAERIGAGIAHELQGLHAHLQESQAVIGRELQGMFETVTTRVLDQQLEIRRLRKQNAQAQSALMIASDDARAQLQQKIEEERLLAEKDRAEMLSKISILIQDSSHKQEKRLANHIEHATKRFKTSESEYRISAQSYEQGMDMVDIKTQDLINTATQSQQSVQTRLTSEWNQTDTCITKIVHTANDVHGQTSLAVDNQMKHMDTQLASLDELVDRVESHNKRDRLAHTSSMALIAKSVHDSYREIQAQYRDSAQHAMRFRQAMVEQSTDCTNVLRPIQGGGVIHDLLDDIRHNVEASQMITYTSNGTTPTKMQYPLPATLPQTAPRDVIIDAMRSKDVVVEQISPKKESPKKRGLSPTKIPLTPSKTRVYNDITRSVHRPEAYSSTLNTDLRSPTQALSTLREVDGNIKPIVLSLGSENEKELKPRRSSGRKTVKTDSSRSKKLTKVIASITENRENEAPAIISDGSAIESGGRMLRNRTS